jgi:hypothetical protein
MNNFRYNVVQSFQDKILSKIYFFLFIFIIQAITEFFFNGLGIYACLWLGKQNVMGLEEKIAKLLKMTFVSSSTSNLFLIWQTLTEKDIWVHMRPCYIRRVVEYVHTDPCFLQRERQKGDLRWAFFLTISRVWKYGELGGERESMW